MKIGYNRKRLRAHLYLSIVWFILGVFQIVIMKDQLWLGFGWLVLAALFIISFLYKSQNKYLTITDQFIKQNIPFGKTIRVSDIKNIKYFSEDYIIKSESKELRINLNLIEPTALEDLKLILTDYDSKLNLSY
ncbi:hypothetical protein [Winogradskyella sp. PE311]|uniref:hypothetical protein n=1 Tax=Winogradskyella sp. PE311 TaxID=3366943 RepID=UPI003980E443